MYDVVVKTGLFADFPNNLTIDILEQIFSFIKNNPSVLSNLVSSKLPSNSPFHTKQLRSGFCALS